MVQDMKFVDTFAPCHFLNSALQADPAVAYDDTAKSRK